MGPSEKVSMENAHHDGGSAGMVLLNFAKMITLVS